MSKLCEADFYYGAMLSTLLNNGFTPVLVESGKDRQIYDFTMNNKKDTRMFIKYRTAPIDTKAADYFSWQFILTPKEITEIQTCLNSDMEFSLGLICGTDSLNESQYAVLHKDVVKELLNQGKTSLTISRKKGERCFRVSVGGSREDAIKVSAKDII